MIKWQDFYTSPKLSQLIKDKKGMLPDDSEYWKSPLSLGWVDVEDDSSFIPYSTFRMCQTNERDFLPFLSPSEMDKKNSPFIPAYHLIQDLALQYHNFFFNDPYSAEGLIEIVLSEIEWEDQLSIKKIEDKIIERISPKRLDDKEA